MKQRPTDQRPTGKSHFGREPQRMRAASRLDGVVKNVGIKPKKK